MIESLENKKVKNWTKLHQKKYRENEYLLLNEDIVKIAKEKGYLKTLIYVGEAPFEFNESYEVSAEVLNKIAKKDGLNFIGIGKRVEEKASYNDRIIILEDLSDPLNIGRIMESAYLFGFDTVLLSNNAADIYHPKCIEASKGAIYCLNIVRKDLSVEIPKLKDLGFRVYATGLRDNTLSLTDVKPHDKMAVILGNEGSGVKEETFDISDDIIKIDMHNIDSLNVAMAGAIIMYEFSNI
ncbi:MAG: RNA methyltransferase [Erysipelotrichaceae bacterium]|nr:RNA methyltransferase [Erysipelotrichaceae bacterium]